MTSNSAGSQRLLSRKSVIMLINTAFTNNSYHFARQSSQKWLELYPNDLFIESLLAKAYLGEGQINSAFSVLNGILKKDPEFIEAYELLAFAAKNVDPILYEESLACVQSLNTNISTDLRLPEWSLLIAESIEDFKQGGLDEAEETIIKVIGTKPTLPLPAIMHLRIVNERKDDTTTLNLSKIYNARWPDCLQFKLFLAEGLMGLRNEKGALKLLNECVINDLIGQVPRRLWGENHRFISLWPETLNIDFQLPIPAVVSSGLGWNTIPSTSDSNLSDGNKESKRFLFNLEEELKRSKSILLDSGEPVDLKNPINIQNPEQSDPSILSQENQIPVQLPDNEYIEPSDKQKYDRSTKESLKSVELVFTRLAKKLNQPEIVKTDNRYPMCILMSSKIGLIRKFGEHTFTVIEQEMRLLSEQIRKKNGWGAAIYFPDDSVSNKRLGVITIEQIDPWKIKLALIDLDKALSKKGEKIGSLIIIGGPDVIPYHKLPNPTDDSDDFISSDNPYATLDTNYYLQNWPVGRIIGENGAEPGLLLAQLRNSIQYHKNQKRRVSWWNKIEFNGSFGQLFGSLRGNLTKNRKGVVSKSFGYTASTWKDSSMAVYRTIGDAKKISISPPDGSGRIKPESTSAPMGYYNLHGIEDGSSWYGQRDLADPIPGPDYPVALTPNDLAKNGKAPKVVFSEACYGGHIIDKKEDDSIAIKFLSIGAQVFIGSTGISYGSVSTPLIGADFLAYLFWYHLESGYSAGEALLQARIDLVREMQKRQGFLDGEDQKTLLSFVLFGDPLIRLDEGQIAKFIQGGLTDESLNIVCEGNSLQLDPPNLSKDILSELKQIVEMYLPGLDDAEIKAESQHKYKKPEMIMNENGTQLEIKSTQKEPTGKVVVSFKKNIKSLQQNHIHYAKATIDSTGKMIKLAISR
jgi:tetratricopeptide (TPR) repeat protein